jgi:NADH:ubiquinone oxidoreductase subunit 6 (subunit J)
MNLLYLLSFNYSAEDIILQFIILLLLLLFANCTNNYYSLFYLFLLILFLGLTLCLLNNELTAGFLWVGEILVVFVFLLLILYVNVHGDSKKIQKKNYIFFVPAIMLFTCI